MANNEISTLCPHCGESSSHTIVPSPAPNSGEVDDSLPTVRSGAAKLQLVCSRCERPWPATLIAEDHLRQLKTAAQSLDDARRQIAMLRLIMSKDQLERAEKSRRDVIKLHEAA